ncbi:MAG: protein-L-isoaspartate(D-aspartate) O-methyltransferase [Zoogloeaceae bacterium]|jgi:protein-L-isoaspartate(D-aspartate) O-methyltransferase|nr:protein-L-isoaspartate(D-aspartate) O-methyltransferase [Zoogloeaceae bacterium]
MNSSSSLAGIGMTSRRTRARMVERLRAQGIKNEPVLAAMATIPRHIFVEEALASRAYEDTALPLGVSGQTISQPYIVARMLEILCESQKDSGGKVLEIGAGCGYQTALLEYLGYDVYAVERNKSLLRRARKNLAQMPRNRARLRHADGNQGWPEAAPFDGIIAAAAALAVPQELLRQLVMDGVLLLPVGGSEQYLYRIQKTSQGFSETRLESVRFVPLLTGVE